MKDQVIKRNKKDLWILCLFLLLTTCLMISIVVAVNIGSASLKIKDILGVMLYKLFKMGSTEQYGNGVVYDIVWFIRLPRLILAVFAGMGLSLCGIVMQAIVKNPLADPYILGVSSGASLGATLAVMLGIGTIFGTNFIGIMGCLGAFIVSIMVVVMSNIGGKSNSVKLLLAGMALSAVCSAFSSFIIYIANDKEGMMTITYWLMGSLAGAKWETIGILMPVVMLSTIFFWTQHRILNLMLLGDEVSITLGRDLNKYRNLYLLIASIVVGFVVYATGMIGFVGLIIPHIVRMVVGSNHKYLIPVSTVLGAILLVWADVLCRVIIPKSELPIGILISMIGAPCFICLMVRKSYGFGGK